MSMVTSPRKKRVFIASSWDDMVEVREAIRGFGLDPVTLDQFATVGTSWIDNLQKCVNDADMVIGVMRDRRKDRNVFFELGVASALNKPTLLFVTPDYPLDLIPPSGIPYLRTDLRDGEAVRFGLKQAMSLSPRYRSHRPSEAGATGPIGAIADQILTKLDQANEEEFEGLIHEAIKASGVSTIARGPEAEAMGIDFAMWSSDLEPTISNPLLIECKSKLNQANLNEVLGRMIRALESIPNGCGIVLYRDGDDVAKSTPRSVPVYFVSAKAFINGLRDSGLSDFVRQLRTASHGF